MPLVTGYVVPESLLNMNKTLGSLSRTLKSLGTTNLGIHNIIPGI